MIRPILQIPAPGLREPCTEVPAGWEKDPAIKQLIADLTDTMHTHHALGLAANQIGVPFRVIAVSQFSHSPWSIFINPVITARGGARLADEEGCMSIDMGRAKFRVKRDQKVTVRFTSRKGDELEKEFSGLAARVLQHEIDHLDGVLIDRPALPRPQGWHSPALHPPADAAKA